MGIGRHASTILLGRNLWETPPLADNVEKTVQETLFNNVFPSAEEALHQAAEYMKQDSERLMPFVGATYPSAGGKRVDYKQRLETWLEQLMLEDEKPNGQQLQILKAVKDRLLLEIQLEIEGPELRRKHQPELFSTGSEEPMRALIHGLPGTGKSRVINWIRRIFMEARDWTHGVQFLCVAFQNKVAYAMGGTTLHTAGDLPIGGSANTSKLSHQDIDGNPWGAQGRPASA